VGDCVGVRGAQHAEATLDRIDSQSAPLVRELFRNPVTAPGTGRRSRPRQQGLHARDNLRYTEASLYTQRDTPMFACAKAPIDAILAQLANMD
jgi:hypothetical protein